MLNLSNCKGFDSHRSGWKVAINALRPLHSKNGILFDDFIERTHSWDFHNYYSGGFRKIPYKEPWVGFFHIPPNCPTWWDNCHTPQSILARPAFQESLKHCLGLFVMTDYLKRFIESQVDVPVAKVFYPTEFPLLKWNEQRFFSNNRKRIIQLGSFLRDYYAIIDVDTEFFKAWFPGNFQYSYYYRKKIEEMSPDWGYIDKKLDAQVWTPVDYLNNEVFDEFLSENIGFMKVYDAAASTGVVECLARNTPLLLNRHEAFEEYLGKDYPFFYDTLDEASKMITTENIIKTHRYMKDLDKSFLYPRVFRDQIKERVEKWQQN